MSFIFLLEPSMSFIFLLESSMTFISPSRTFHVFYLPSRTFHVFCILNLSVCVPGLKGDYTFKKEVINKTNFFQLKLLLYLTLLPYSLEIYGDILHACFHADGCSCPCNFTLSQVKNLKPKDQNPKRSAWCKQYDSNYAILHFHCIVYIWSESSFNTLWMELARLVWIGGRTLPKSTEENVLFLCARHFLRFRVIGCSIQIMVFLSVHLSQVKNWKGGLTLTAYASNYAFCIGNDHCIATLHFPCLHYIPFGSSFRALWCECS